MKRFFIFILFLGSFVMSVEFTCAQEEILNSANVRLFGKENPSRKEMKKTFRELRRTAPDRTTKKLIRSKEKEFYELLEKDKRQLASLKEQKAKIQKLLAEIEMGKIAEVQLVELRAENDSLRAIMRNYIKNIDSLNTVNLRLETVHQTLGDYYFNLAGFVEPKIYYFENTTYPELSQYWRISSSLKDSSLITEAFGLDLEQIEFFKEKYDSIGSRVVEYISIHQSDSIFSDIKESEVYRWASNEEYSYSIKFIRSGFYSGFSKERKFQAIDSMEVLGQSTDVVRFEDKYTFYNGFVTNVRQQAFYSKEYGLVRYVRFDERTRVNETYVLKKVLSEAEWLKLQE